MIWKQLTHAVAQLVANGSPCGRHIEIANVVSHETGARAEQGQVRSALFHQTQLIGLNRFAQLVIAYFQVSYFRTELRRIQIGNLCVAPVFQCLRGSGVVTVTINDQRFLGTHEGVQLKNEERKLSGGAGP